MGLFRRTKKAASGRAARETQPDPNGAFRQRILDYLSQGAITRTLERLVHRPQFDYDDWIGELVQIAGVDDAREMRGYSVQLLSSYPDHPGLLLARALSEALDDRGDLREFGSNLDSSIRYAREVYAVSDEKLNEFGRWLLDYAETCRVGSLVLAVATLERRNVAIADVRRIEEEALVTSGADAGVRVLALASVLERSSEELSKIIERYEGART